MRTPGTEAFLRVLLALFTAFLIHRGLTATVLSPETDWQLQDHLLPFFVGGLSDIWVAVIGACAALICVVLAARKVPRAAFGISYVVWFWLPVILLFVHHGYVNFFQVQILPHHLSYLTDEAFLEANQDAGLDGRAYVFIITSAIGFLIWGHVTKSARRWSKRKQIGAVVTVCLVGLGAHMLNIRWRVNFMVPENLQVNTFEKFYLNVKNLPVPAPLSDAEFKFVAAQYRPDATDLAALLDSASSHPRSSLVALKELFDERRKTGRKPMIVTVLLESARPADFGIFAPPNQQADLTPVFTGLMKKGVWFTHAYNTGSVTRAGQEAVWCGFPSAVGISLMRERQDLDVDCLPRLLKDQAEMFWFHGGKGAFDGQESFWRRQGVGHILTQESFSTDTLKTNWGVSDLELLQRSLTELAELRTRTTKSALVGLILTITNHIPWDLPADAPNRVRSLRVEHPSYATTAYVDWALGEWVQQLKQIGLWDDLILVLTSDHGARHPLYHDIYRTHERENAVAHAVLGISGGIVEEFTRASSVVIEDHVSQMDVAAWIGSMFEVKVAPTAFGLDGMRIRPIGVDLEDRIFFPDLDFTVGKQAVYAGKENELDPKRKLPVLYYRAMINWLLTQSRK